jgi:hypothetical protein
MALRPLGMQAQSKRQLEPSTRGGLGVNGHGLAIGALETGRCGVLHSPAPHTRPPAAPSPRYTLTHPSHYAEKPVITLRQDDPTRVHEVMLDAGTMGARWGLELLHMRAGLVRGLLRVHNAGGEGGACPQRGCMHMNKPSVSTGSRLGRTHMKLL